MLVTRAYRHKARFTPEQERSARRFAGCARLVYNAGLEQRRLGYAVTGRGMSYMRQTSFLKEVKADPDFAFLREVPAHVLQQALRDLDRAFQNFFAGRARYPRPRRRGERDGFRFPDPDPKQIGVHDPARVGRVRLPKLGWVSVRNCFPRLGGRLFEGELRHVSVVREADGWYVSFCCEVDLDLPDAPAGGPVGLDLGVVASVVVSDGRLVRLPVPDRRGREKIGLLQSVVNRRRKGSCNREKARVRLARRRQRDRRRRLDAVHKLTAALAAGHGLVAVEDLKVAAMTRSARGTAGEPGVNVAQKAGLNRAILDHGWGEIRRQLAYKTRSCSCTLVVVDPRHSSQQCRVCGHTAGENRESQAVFRCVACGHTDHADVNAARIILQRGLEAHSHDHDRNQDQDRGRSRGTGSAPPGGTPGREPALAGSNACEDRVSLKTPETPGPSRKARPRGHARLTPARA